MGERERRVGHNEVLYREINERIEDLNDEFGELTGTITVVCECGDATCAEAIDVAIAQYERVRRDPRRFIVRPEHVIDDVEEVVETGDDYWVVVKRGEAGDVAAENDPR